jgi:aminoglycoside phosphotransferase (APT) family kinase protein
VNLSDGYKDRFHRFIDSVPSTPTCLHGDLHIGNIITDGTRDLWIDVGDFAYGVPEWDLGMLYYSSHFLSADRADNIFHLDNDTLKAHWDVFAPAYYGTHDEQALEAEVKKLHPFIAAKTAYVISKLRDGKHPCGDYLIQLFDKYLPE